MKKGASYFAKTGLLTRNPAAIQLLGLCFVLAASASLKDALTLGACAVLVLVCSNVTLSLLRGLIPDSARVAAYLITAAGFVTVAELAVSAWLPSAGRSLGIYLPLMAVNSLFLARADAFASENGPAASALDGVFMGLGYALVLIITAFVRELLGQGRIFGFAVFGRAFAGVPFFALPAGAFVCLGFVTAAFRFVKRKTEERK